MIITVQHKVGFNIYEILLGSFHRNSSFSLKQSLKRKKIISSFFFISLHISLTKSQDGWLLVREILTMDDTAFSN